MKLPKSDQAYTKEEAEKRFKAALKVAVNTPPKPVKGAKKRAKKKRG